MAMTPVDSNLSGSTVASPIHSNDPPTETTPLIPAKACLPSSIEPDLYEKEEKIDPRAYALLPALAIGVFLAAADQTIVISSYGIIGSEMNALDKSSWLATAYVPLHTALNLLKIHTPGSADSLRPATCSPCPPYSFSMERCPPHSGPNPSFCSHTPHLDLAVSFAVSHKP